MAATFVVEDGTGLTTANSFTAVAEADDYVANYATSAVAAIWNALSTSDKQLYLRQGSSYVDLTYTPRWLGRKTTQYSGLSWPRSYMRDRDRRALASNNVPKEVKYATAEVALAAAQGDDLMPALAAGDGSISSTSDRVGPLSTSVSYLAGTRTKKKYTKANRWIDVFLSPSAQVDRG